MTRKQSIGLAAMCLLPLLAMPASAEVRFGKNVRVGGHDFSNRTFNKNRNAVIHLHNNKPRNAGCQWVIHRDAKGRPTGRKTQVCNLQSVPAKAR